MTPRIRESVFTWLSVVGKAADYRVLGTTTPSAQNQWTTAFVQRLRELGWIEGRNVAIEYRWGEGRSERFAEIAARGRQLTREARNMTEALGHGVNERSRWSCKAVVRLVPTNSERRARLAVASLKAAIRTRQPPKGCIRHSDRGSQYASELYRKTEAASSLTLLSSGIFSGAFPVSR
jgi:hypothetical protein